MNENPNETVIKVDKLYKDFILPHEQSSSVKGIFTGMFSKATSKKEKQHALKSISFEVKKGEFFGIVGRNGSGKSTLLKILAGIYQPTDGKVSHVGKLVPFIELGVGFNPELTGRDNVYLNGAMLGFSVKEIDSMYKDIVGFAELERFMDQKLKNYSSGMQVRLAFSMAIRSEADILLIDEVLAVGDADFQRKCFDYFRKLKKYKKTVVIVTHDMNAIREYCDRAVMIEKSELIEQGSPTKVATSYTRMFMDNGTSTTETEDVSERWGDASIEYNRVETNTKKLRDGEDIVFTLRATAKKDIEKPIFGFVIRNAASENVFGTNTQIKRVAVDKVAAGESINVEWRMPNILSDGKYFFDPAIVYMAGNKVADWWEGAAEFSIYKEEITPYIVNPDISFTYHTDK